MRRRLGLCCDPDHSSPGNNVLGFVLAGGGCRIVQCHLGHIMNWHRAVTAFTFAIYLGSNAAFGGMLPPIEALGNPAVHKVQKWVKPFHPYHVDMPADVLKRDQQFPLAPLGQQIAPPMDGESQVSKRVIEDEASGGVGAPAFDLNAALRLDALDHETLQQFLDKRARSERILLVPSSRSVKALIDEQPPNWLLGR
jgi:hypothetical protein